MIEKERELRKKAIKEKREVYEQIDSERITECTDRKVERKKKTQDQNIKYTTEPVKEERVYKRKSMKKKELVSTEPKEQAIPETNSKEINKVQEPGER